MVHFVWDLGTGCGQEESHIFMSAPLQSLVYQGAPEVTGTNRAVCTPNYLQGRWQRPGNEQRDNKFPSKESSAPNPRSLPQRRSER